MRLARHKTVSNKNMRSNRNGTRDMVLVEGLLMARFTTLWDAVNACKISRCSHDLKYLPSISLAVLRCRWDSRSSNQNHDIDVSEDRRVSMTRLDLKDSSPIDDGAITASTGRCGDIGRKWVFSVDKMHRIKALRPETYF